MRDCAILINDRLVSLSHNSLLLIQPPTSPQSSSPRYVRDSESCSECLGLSGLLKRKKIRNIWIFPSNLNTFWGVHVFWTCLKKLEIFGYFHQIWTPFVLNSRSGGWPRHCCNSCTVYVLNRVVSRLNSEFGIPLFMGVASGLNNKSTLVRTSKREQGTRYQGRPNLLW
jgi:hypothetical protein